MNQNRKSLNLYEDELIAELDKVSQPLPQRPQGFGISVQKYMKKKNVSESTARRILKKALSLGWERKQMKNYDGHLVYVFYKP